VHEVLILQWWETVAGAQFVNLIADVLATRGVVCIDRHDESRPVQTADYHDYHD